MSESSGSSEQRMRRINKTNNRRQHRLDHKQHERQQHQKQQQQQQPLLDSWTSATTTTNSYLNLNYLKLVLVFIVLHLIYTNQVSSQQLPDDIQRELNQNLAEQARLQALRARHQQLIQARAQQGNRQQQQQAKQLGASAGTSGQQQQPAKPAHDPNNYSYQQVSPPIQYSYYQPYGDLASPQQQQQQGAQPAGANQAAGPQQPINIDLNNLSLDLPNMPTPQAQTAPAQKQQQHLVPHFTGAGGLPVLQPLAAANQSPDTFAPAGQPPLQPQAQTAGGPPVQQGPPLTEADFKDITGGENYGAPGGTDFGMASGNQGTGSNGGGGGDVSDPASEPRGSSSSSSGDGDTDAQLREFGMNDGQSADAARPAPAPQQRQDNPMASMMQDLGGFNPMEGAGAGGSGNRGQARQRQAGGGGGFDPFGAAGFGGGGSGFPMGNDMGGGFGVPMMGGGGGSARRQIQPSSSTPASDFDFASQPSSQSQGGDNAQGAAMNGGAPGSLQGLLGNAFPGLGGGPAASMGLDALARGNNAPDSQLDDGMGQQQQQGAAANRNQRTDDGVMDMADMGADLGGFDQPPSTQNDQDFNLAAAAAEQQPRSVPYPDGGPQFVGTLWALGQPQSLTQTRYNPLPDKGTYQDYPAYQSGGNDFGAVARVVDETPRARRAGPGRYSLPSPNALAPEHRSALSAGQQYNYAQGPLVSRSDDGYSSSLLSREFEDNDDFVD